MTNQKKICVVGGGYWGKNHIKTLIELNAFHSVVEKDFKNSAKLTNQFDKIKVYKNIEESFEDNSIDGYIIATPAKTHFELAEKIITLKKPVLIEKPFTLSVPEAKKLIKLSQKNNSAMMAGHLLLFHPALIKIKKMLKEKKIGKILYIYSNRLNFGKIRDHENVLWSLGPHDISIFQYLVGSFPEKIHAEGSAKIQKNIHDFVMLNLKYKNNISGHIFLSWLNPFKEHKLVVIGSKGALVFEDSAQNSPLKLYSGNYSLKDGLVLHKPNNVKEIAFSSKAPLKEELKHFINNLESNLIKTAGAENALEVTKIIVNADKRL